MAIITTNLIEFADNGNSRTLTAPGHTALKPRIVIQKRKVATNATSSLEDTLDVVYGTTDSEGAMLANKVCFSASVKRPIQGQTTDVKSALGLFRELVASEEFEAMVVAQSWVK